MTKEEIRRQCDLAWQERFLELAGLCVGDEVECYFTPSLGNASSVCTVCVRRFGTIVSTDKGIFVKSKDKMYKAYKTDGKKWELRLEYLYSKIEHIILD